MNYEDYERIGKELKRLNPGRWPDNTDEEVGVVGVQHGLWPPKTQHGTPPSADIWFPGFQAERTHKVTQFIQAKQELQSTLNSYNTNLELTDRQLAHSLEVLPTHLAHQEHALEVAHELLVAQSDNGITVAKEAESRLLDIPTFGLVRLEEEKVKTDKIRAQDASAIKIQEAKELDANRIKVARQEMEMDIQGVIGMGLKGIEMLDYLSFKIEALENQGASRTRIKYLEDYRDKMAGRLLQEAPQLNLGEAGEATDSPSGD